MGFISLLLLSRSWEDPRQRVRSANLLTIIVSLGVVTWIIIVLVLSLDIILLWNVLKTGVKGAGGGAVVPSVNLAARWNDGRRHAWATLLCGKSTQHPLYRRLGGPLGRSGRVWRRENLFSHPDASCVWGCAAPTVLDVVVHGHSFQWHYTRLYARTVATGCVLLRGLLLSPCTIMCRTGKNVTAKKPQSLILCCRRKRGVKIA